ncbi:MAG: hypothetical protein HUK14_06880 [Muribaculaceae bacterium]|nr:hypothetical protein [Muribaculaceae bacterium]
MRKILTLFSALLACALTASADGLTHKIYYYAPEGTKALFSEAFSGIIADDATQTCAPGSNDGWVVEAVYADNNEVYLKNFDASCSITKSYVRGTLEGDRLVCKTWQCIDGFNNEYSLPARQSRGEYEEWTWGKDGTYFYLAPVRYDEAAQTYVADRSLETFTIALSGDTYTLEFPDGMALAKVSEDGTWLGTLLTSCELTLFTETAITELPEGATTQKWVLSGNVDAAVVDLAIAGNDVYFSGDLGYVRGIIDGNKVSFKSDQYIGIDKKYNYFAYIVSGKQDDGYVRTDEIVLTYDAEAKTMTSADNEALFANLGKADAIHYRDIYAPVTLKWQDPDFTPAKPRTPTITNVYHNDDYDFYTCEFSLPHTDIDGNLLDAERMYYHFLRDGEVFTFHVSEYHSIIYNGLLEMVDVPYTYTDPYEWYFLGGDTPPHSLLYFFNDAKSIGLQLFYNDEDGQVLASDIATYKLSSLPAAETSAEVIATSYYSLSGQPMAQPAAGFCIRVETLADGTRRARKCLIQ